MDESAMLGYGGGNPSQAPAGYYEAKMARQPTLKERLDLAVAQAEARLKAVQEARDIFERNPDLEKLLDVMQRGMF